MPTTLAFENSFQVGQSMHDLGTVEVRDFAQIRILAFARRDSLNLKITLVAEEPGHRIATLDTLLLGPGESATRVYDVPGTMVAVFAEAAGDERESTGAGAVYIWGRT